MTFFLNATVDETVWIRKQHAVTTTTKKTKSSTVVSGGNGGRNAEVGPRTGLIYWRENLVAVVGVIVVVVVVVVDVVAESRSVRLTSPPPARLRPVSFGRSHWNIKKRDTWKKERNREGMNTGSCFVFARNPWKDFADALLRHQRIPNSVDWL